MMGRPMVIAGIVLVVIGVVALAYQGITYTSRETVLDIGDIEVQADTRKTVSVPPILGGLRAARHGGRGRKLVG